MKLEFSCKCFEAPSRWLAIETMDERIICSTCEKPFLVTINSILNHPRVSLTNTIITPEFARIYARDAWPMSHAEADQDRINLYAELMSTHRWTDSLIGQGGYLCPITLINSRILLGVNRLIAAEKANYTIHAAFATIMER